LRAADEPLLSEDDPDLPEFDTDLPGANLRPRGNEELPLALDDAVLPNCDPEAPDGGKPTAAWEPPPASSIFDAEPKPLFSEPEFAPDDDVICPEIAALAAVTVDAEESPSPARLSCRPNAIRAANKAYSTFAVPALVSTNFRNSNLTLRPQLVLAARLNKQA